VVNSRNKGSAYERDVKNRLMDSLGLEFRRVLDQWAEAGLPDLVCDDREFPFIIECKRYKQGSTFANPAHWDQVCHAATKYTERRRVLRPHEAAKLPALVYKYDRLPERWRVPIQALAMLSAFNPAQDIAEQYDWKYACEMSFDDFCMVCRELLAVSQCEVGALPSVESVEGS